MSAVPLSAYEAALAAADRYRYTPSPQPFSEYPPCNSFSRF
jgi:hypothetical protein